MVRISTILGIVCCLMLAGGLASAEANWTFMVYMDGDCDLEESAIDDMNEMEMVGSTGEVNIIALLDRIPGYDDSNGDWVTTKLFEVTEDQNSDRIIRQPKLRIWANSTWEIQTHLLTLRCGGLRITRQNTTH